MTPARHLPLAASPLVLLANSPAVSSPCRRGFLFGAVAGSVGQTPAAIQTPSGGFGSLQTATARTALPANAVASQGAA